jgi:hypothetical protein
MQWITSLLFPSLAMFCAEHPSEALVHNIIWLLAGGHDIQRLLIFWESSILVSSRLFSVASGIPFVQNLSYTSTKSSSIFRLSILNSSVIYIPYTPLNQWFQTEYSRSADHVPPCILLLSVTKVLCIRSSVVFVYGAPKVRIVHLSSFA